METLSLLAYPLIACVLLILIHAYFGLHVLERGIIFVDLSLAQFIGLGIAFSLLLGDSADVRFASAVLFAIAGAFILSFSRHISRLVNIEAFIGILYVFSFSASILILDKTPHGLEELKAILNGNILWVTTGDLRNMAILYAVVGVIHVLFKKRFFALTYEGRGGFFWEFLFFLSFALVLVSSVKIAGILQVFAFLVIPALIGRLYTKKPVSALLLGWLAGLVASIAGIVLSFAFDLPTAPLIVASLCLVFFVLTAVKAVREPRSSIARH